MSQLNIQVAVITSEPVRMDSPVNFSYYFDAQKKLYNHYGMNKAGFWDLWGVKTWLIYLRLLIKGLKMEKSHGDIHQRGGDILIDPRGKVVYHHVAGGPADRTDPETIFSKVENKK